MMLIIFKKNPVRFVAGWAGTMGTNMWLCFLLSVGNKIDLDKDRHVSVEEAER